MAKSMFSTEVSSKIEKEDNRFVACRALSLRARAVNTHKEEEAVEEEMAPSAQALADYTDGRIGIQVEPEEES